MSKKLQFVWIDDDPSREKSSQILEKQLKVTCKFIGVKEPNVDFMAIIDVLKPDLILLDQNLTKMPASKIKKGSTIAAFIREKHPTYAIACITGQQKNDLDSQQRSSFEAIFSYDDIKTHYPAMKSIAESFRKLKQNKPKNADELFSLIKAPDEDLIKLKNILPHNIKENFSDHGLCSNISHWVRNVLIERPGFLYDGLWAATLLGLNEAGFKKVKHLFKAAKYKGLFADESNERWWRSELLRVLGNRVKDTGLPWEKGRQLDDSLNKRHYSKDYYSTFKEEFPETVAYLDINSKERAAMKLKYTELHPKYDKLLFFEDMRMMKAD